jgi:hypothetical protein
MINEDFSNLDELKVLKWIETHSALNSQAKVQNLLKRADPRSNDCKSEIFTCIRKSAVLMGINPPTVKELSSTIQERAKRSNNSSEPPAQIKELLDRQHKKIENLQSKVDVYLQQIVQMQINKNRGVGPPKTWQPKQPKRFEQPKPQPVMSATGAIIEPTSGFDETVNAVILCSGLSMPIFAYIAIFAADRAYRGPLVMMASACALTWACAMICKKATKGV